MWHETGKNTKCFFCGLLGAIGFKRSLLFERFSRTGLQGEEWAQLDSNQRPTSYEPAALTTELWALAECIVSYLPPPGKRVIPDFKLAKVAVTLTCNSFRDRLSYGYLFPDEFTLNFQIYLLSFSKRDEV